jgi:hypothetical protein
MTGLLRHVQKIACAMTSQRKILDYLQSISLVSGDFAGVV